MAEKQNPTQGTPERAALKADKGEDVWDMGVLLSPTGKLVHKGSLAKEPEEETDVPTLEVEVVEQVIATGELYNGGEG